MSLLFPKPGISGPCNIKSQSLFPVAAVFYSSGLSNFQESWANRAPDRAKGEQLMSPHLLLLPTFVLGGTGAEFEPCISISQAPKLSTQFSFRSGRYFFIYFKGLWCTLLDGCLDLLFNELPQICTVSQLKASQLIQRECRCLRFSQEQTFPSIDFYPFHIAEGRGTLANSFATGNNKEPTLLQNCWIQKVLG